MDRTSIPGKSILLLKSAFVLLLFFLCSLVGLNSAKAQIAGGTYTYGSVSANYLTLGTAISAINGIGISGPVILNPISGYTAETAPASGGAGSVIGATGSGYVIAITTNAPTATNTLTINGGGTVTLTATHPGTTNTSVSDAVITIAGTNYVTINGFTLKDAATNTTAGATNNTTEFGVAIVKGTTAALGSQHCAVTNCIIQLSNGVVNNNSIGIYSNSDNSYNTVYTTSVVPTSVAGSNASNTFTGNTISGVTSGIVLIGDATYNDVGVTVGGSGLGNTITLANRTANMYSTYINYAANEQDGVFTVNNNTLAISYNNISLATGSTGNNVNGIFTSTSGGATTYTNTIGTNTINITSAATTQYQGIQNASGISTSTIGITSNTVTLNLTGSAGGVVNNCVWNTANVNTLNVTSNRLSISSSNNTSQAITGIFNGGNLTTENINSNNINLPTGNSTSVFGIYNAGTATNSSISFDTVVCSSSYTASIYGIYNNKNLTNSNFSNNNISLTGTSSGSNTNFLCIDNQGATPTQAYNNNNLTINSVSSNAYVSDGIVNPTTASVSYTYTRDTINITNTNGAVANGIIVQPPAVITPSNKINYNKITISIGATNISSNSGIFNTGSYTADSISFNKISLTSVVNLQLIGIINGGTIATNAITDNNINITGASVNVNQNFGVFNNGSSSVSLSYVRDTVTMWGLLNPFALHNNATIATANFTNNRINLNNSNTTTTIGKEYGFFNIGAITTLNIANNNVKLIDQAVGTQDTAFGIYNATGTSTTGNFVFDTVSAVSTGGGVIMGVFNSEPMTSLQVNNDSLTLNGTTSSTYVYGLFNTAAIPTQKYNNNKLEMSNATNSASYNTYGIYNSGNASTLDSVYANTISISNPGGANGIGIQYLGVAATGYYNSNNDSVQVSGSTGQAMGISNTGTIATALYNNNIIYVTAVGGLHYGINHQNGTSLITDTISNNRITMINTSGTNGVYGINSTAITSGNQNYSNNRIRIQSAQTGTGSFGISSTGAGVRAVYAFDTVTIVNTQGAPEYGVYNTASHSAVDSMVSDSLTLGASGAALNMYGLYNTGTTPLQKYNANKIKINNAPSTTGNNSYGIYNTANASISDSVYANNINLLSPQGANSCGIYYGGTTPIGVFNNNTDSVQVGSSAGQSYGINDGGTITTALYNNNTIYATAAGGLHYGINHQSGTGLIADTISNNRITMINTTGSNGVYGINSSAVTTGGQAYNNNRVRISSSQTGNTCYGINVTGTGTTANFLTDTINLVGITSGQNINGISNSGAHSVACNMQNDSITVTAASGQTVIGLNNTAAVPSQRFSSDIIVENNTSGTAITGYGISSTGNATILDSTCGNYILLSHTSGAKGFGISFTATAANGYFNNNFDSLYVNGTAGGYGIYNNGTINTVRYNSNNINVSSGGSDNVGIFNNASGVTDTMNNNRITLINTTGSPGNAYGLWSIAATTSGQSYNNNRIRINDNTGNGTGYGINTTGAAASPGTVSYNNDSITIVSAGAPLYGIYNTGSHGLAVSMTNDSISLTGNGSSGIQIVGLFNNGATPTQKYNNSIIKIRASGISYGIQVAGNATTIDSMCNNNIVAANIGNGLAEGIYYHATSPNIYINNNIDSVIANGTGVAYGIDNSSGTITSSLINNNVVYVANGSNGNVAGIINVNTSTGSDTTKQ